MSKNIYIACYIASFIVFFLSDVPGKSYSLIAQLMIISFVSIISAVFWGLLINLTIKAIKLTRN